MSKLLFIAGGGALGSVLRYLVQGWVQTLSGGMFPLGTFVVNIFGCLVIGFLNKAFTETLLIRPEYRLALTVGVLGGFTTFSAFGWETFSLANEGQALRASVNALLSVGTGLAAVWLGYRLAEHWLGA